MHSAFRTTAIVVLLAFIYPVKAGEPVA